MAQKNKGKHSNAGTLGQVLFIDYHAWRTVPVGAGLAPAQNHEGDHKGRPYGDTDPFVPVGIIGHTTPSSMNAPVGAGLVPARNHEGNHKAYPYMDIPGFCKSATLEEIAKHGHVLTPGRYMGAADVADDGEPFEEKMARLPAQWCKQRTQAAKLDAAIEANLIVLCFTGAPQ